MNRKNETKASQTRISVKSPESRSSRQACSNFLCESHDGTDHSVEEMILNFCSTMKKEKLPKNEIKEKLSNLLQFSLVEKSQPNNDEDIEQNLNILSRLYKDLGNQKPNRLDGEFHSNAFGSQNNFIDDQSNFQQFSEKSLSETSSIDASADIDALLNESPFEQDKKWESASTQEFQDFRESDTFRIRIESCSNQFEGSDLRVLADLIKSDKIFLDTNERKDRVISHIVIKANNCTAQEFYKITMWLKNRRIIREEMRDDLMLSYFENKTPQSSKFDYEMIIQEYEGLNATVKTICDRFLLKFFKLMNPTDYKKRIVTIDPKEIIETICSLGTTSESVLNMLLSNTFSNYVKMPTVDLPNEILPARINEFLDGARNHFLNIFSIAAILNTKDRLDSDSVSFKALLSSANEYFYNYKGRENCVQELQVLMEDIKNASINHCNNSLANKIRKTVEALLSSLYKK